MKQIEKSGLIVALLSYLHLQWSAI